MVRGKLISAEIMAASAPGAQLLEKGYDPVYPFKAVPVTEGVVVQDLPDLLQGLIALSALSMVCR